MDPVDINYQLHDIIVNNLTDRPNPLEDLTNEIFLHHFHLDKDTFVDLLGRLELDRQTLRSNPLPRALQLALTLKFYATGCYQYILGHISGISQASVSRIINSTSDKIAAFARTHIFFPRTKNKKNGIAEKFRHKVRIPTVIGCIDCTHIKIQAPREHARVFINRKGYYSLNIQLVCDSEGTFTNIVARHPGSAHDSRIFNNSELRNRLEAGDLHGYMLIGDGGYACAPYLMTPIRNPHTRAENLYNYHFVRTRNVIERSFGVLKARFCVLRPDSRIRLHYEAVSKVTIACCVLHNMCINRNLPV